MTVDQPPLPRLYVNHLVAARALFGSGNSINREYFNAAVKAQGEEALGLWLACLVDPQPPGQPGDRGSRDR